MIQAARLDCVISYSDYYECLSLCLRMGKMRTFGWPCDLISDFESVQRSWWRTEKHVPEVEAAIWAKAFEDIFNL